MILSTCYNYVKTEWYGDLDSRLRGAAGTQHLLKNAFGFETHTKESLKVLLL